MDQMREEHDDVFPRQDPSVEVLAEEAVEAKEHVKERVVDLRETTGSRVRQELDRRSTDIGSGARQVAAAVRDTGDRLRQDGNELGATVAERTAEGFERAGHYLESADPDRLMADVRDAGRRMPWAFVGAGLLAGFGAARLLRSSGERSNGSAS